MKDDSEIDTNKHKHALTNPYENNNIFFNVHRIKFTFYIDFFVKYLFGRGLNAKLYRGVTSYHKLRKHLRRRALQQ